MERFRKKAMTQQQLLWITVTILFLLISLVIMSGAGDRIFTVMGNLFKGVGWG